MKDPRLVQELSTVPVGGGQETCWSMKDPRLVQARAVLVGGGQETCWSMKDPRLVLLLSGWRSRDLLVDERPKPRPRAQCQVGGGHETFRSMKDPSLVQELMQCQRVEVMRPVGR